MTSSSLAPKDKFILSEIDLLKLVSWVKSEPNIKRIHFSGGEPTLHLELIRKIQKDLPNLSYAMTTNGWYGNRFEQIFENLNLDLIFYSYDRFHKPFITSDTLSKSLKASVAKGIRTYIKFTISDISDFELLPEIKIDGVGVILNSLVAAGRAIEENLNISTPLNEAFWNSSCPSLGEERVDNLERIIFYPNKGLTPCCGPLADSKSINQNFVFSPLGTDYFSENKFYKKLKSGSFNTQKQPGLTYSKTATSPCSLCEEVYDNAKKPTLILDTILEKTTSPTVYPINGPLKQSEKEKLETHFKFAYIFQKLHTNRNDDMLKTQNVNYDLSLCEIELQSINFDNLKVAVDLFSRIFKFKNSDSLQLFDFKLMEAKLSDFLINSNASFLYFHKGNPVAIIGQWNDLQHPLLNSKVNHIGAIGYDSSQLSKLQRQTIKNHWAHLIEKSEANSVSGSDHALSSTARIDIFNLSSQNLFKQFGFSISGLELVPL